MPTTAHDITAQKTAELDSVPGAILGLDGWMLRSIPQAMRERFLQGYERVLRTVFHPDLYQDVVIKKGKERFLQAVHESITFLLGDYYAWEAAVDSIPTARNPFIQAKRDLDIRDEIIRTLSVRNDELNSKLRSALESNSALMSNFELEREDRRKELNYAHSVKVAAEGAHCIPLVSKYAIPLNVRWPAVVNGRLVADTGRSERNILVRGSFGETPVIATTTLYGFNRIVEVMMEKCDSGKDDERQRAFERLTRTDFNSDFFKCNASRYLLRIVFPGAVVFFKSNGGEMTCGVVQDYTGSLVEALSPSLARQVEVEQSRVRAEKEMRMNHWRRCCDLSEANKRLLKEAKALRKEVEVFRLEAKRNGKQHTKTT